MTKTELNKMSMAALVALYNKHSGKKAIKKFRDKATAVSRTAAVIPAGKSTPKASSSTAAKRLKKVPEDSRRERLDLKAGKIKEHREGTGRAEALKLMLRKSGASLQEIMDATGWHYRAALAGVRLVHVKLGYGLRENDKGRITAFTK